VPAIDDDEDGIDDAYEMYLAQRYAPILHKHAYDLQEDLASIWKWTLPGANCDIHVSGYNLLNQFVWDWDIFNLIDQEFHQSFINLSVTNPDAKACSYGCNEWSEWGWKRLNFNDDWAHNGETIGNRPLYFHVYKLTPYVFQLQYWYFLAYNDLRQYNQTYNNTYHEGDWEHVEIRILNYQSGEFCSLCHTEEPEPLLVNFYQHHSGYTRYIDECWWSSDEGEMQYGWDPNHNHLNVYIAANSHASYNRFDHIYHLNVVELGTTLENYWDNVDYSDYCPLTFDWDILENMGEVEVVAPYDCYLMGTWHEMDHHRMPVGDITPDWLAWVGWFGNEYFEGILDYGPTYCPSSPAVSAYWDTFIEDHDHFIGEPHPEYVSWVPDMPWGDFGPGVSPVVPSYSFDSVPIKWWSISENYSPVSYEVYRSITNGDPEESLFTHLISVSPPDTTYIDKDVIVPSNDQDNILYYYVTFIDSTGTESSPEYISLKVPEAPNGINGSAYAPDWHPVITWNLDREYCLKGYNIYKEVTIGDSIIVPFTKLNSEIIRDTTWIDSAFIVDHQGNETAYYYVTAMNFLNGESAPSDTVSGAGNSIDGTDGIQAALDLLNSEKDYVFSISPNPFNHTAQIIFAVATEGESNLSLFNLLGQKVIELYDGRVEKNVVYSYTLDGSSLSTGLYICQLQTKKVTIHKKLILLK